MPRAEEGFRNTAPNSVQPTQWLIGGGETTRPRPRDTSSLEFGVWFGESRSWRQRGGGRSVVFRRVD